MDYCSQALGDKDHVQEIICTMCVEMTILPNLIDFQSHENWKNQGSVNKKLDQIQENPQFSKTNSLKNKRMQALYLTQSKSIIKDKISIKKHASITLIKHGSLKALLPVKLDGHNVLLAYTCDFVSSAQIVLTGSYHFEVVDQLVSILSSLNNI